MHEMALMGDILRIVEEDAILRELKRINKIELLVGEISNAMPDALEMAFAIYKEQNMGFFSEDAKLVILKEEAQAKCVLCDLEYGPEQKISVCPSCLIPSGKIISGESFKVLSYEGS